MLKSCCLHNDRARDQCDPRCPSYFSHLLCTRSSCSTTYVISLLHQQFTFVNLFNTHLLCSPRLFNSAWYDIVGGPLTIFQRTSFTNKVSQIFFVSLSVLASCLPAGRLCSKKLVPSNRLYFPELCHQRWTKLCDRQPYHLILPDRKLFHPFQFCRHHPAYRLWTR